MKDDLKTRIEKLEKKLKEAESEKVRAEENLKMAFNRKNEILEEMRKYDVTQDSITDNIEKLSKEMKQLLEEVEEGMEN